MTWPALSSYVIPFPVQLFVPFIQEFVLAYDWIPWYKSQWNEIELSWGSENEFLNWSKAELCSEWHVGINKEGEKEGKDEEQVTWESKSKKRRKWTWYSHKKRPIFLSIRYNKETFLVLERDKNGDIFISLCRRPWPWLPAKKVKSNVRHD